MNEASHLGCSSRGLQPGSSRTPTSIGGALGSGKKTRPPPLPRPVPRLSPGNHGPPRPALRQEVSPASFPAPHRGSRSRIRRRGWICNTATGAAGREGRREGEGSRRWRRPNGAAKGGDGGEAA